MCAARVRYISQPHRFRFFLRVSVAAGEGERAGGGREGSGKSITRNIATRQWRTSSSLDAARRNGLFAHCLVVARHVGLGVVLYVEEESKRRRPVVFFYCGRRPVVVYFIVENMLYDSDNNTAAVFVP